MSIQRAERELAALQQEIERMDLRLGEARSREIKLRHYIEMAREFGDDGAVGAVRPDESATPSTNGVRQRTPQGGMSGRAVRVSAAILRERGNRPIQTRELYDLLQQQGIRFGGSTPIASLSGYLSRAPEFVNDRASGWSLREPQQPSEGDSALPREAQGYLTVVDEERQLAI